MIKIRAKLKKNRARSFPLAGNKVYELELVGGGRMYKVTVFVNNKPIKTYINIIDFLKDWEIISKKDPRYKISRVV